MFVALTVFNMAAWTGRFSAGHTYHVVILMIMMVMISYMMDIIHTEVGLTMIVEVIVEVATETTVVWRTGRCQVYPVVMVTVMGARISGQRRDGSYCRGARYLPTSVEIARWHVVNVKTVRNDVIINRIVGGLVTNVNRAARCGISSAGVARR